MPSTEQVLTFLAVLQHRSFSAAAKTLNRTQSSVTYAIQKLEADLGVPVFDRAIRWPTLTQQGKALLPAACRMVRKLEAMQRTADGLAQGLEGKLLVVVDAVFPMARPLAALAEFQTCFPTVRVRVGVEAVHSAAEAILNGTAMLGVVGPVVERYPDLSFLPLGSIERIAVAAAGHPLAQWPSEVPAAAFREHIQLVPSSRSREPRRRQFNLPSPAVWRMNDMGMKHVAILAGLGWGRLPQHVAQADLEAGRLIRLRVERLEGVTGRCRYHST